MLLRCSYRQSYQIPPTAYSILRGKRAKTESAALCFAWIIFSCEWTSFSTRANTLCTRYGLVMLPIQLVSIYRYQNYTFSEYIRTIKRVLTDFGFWSEIFRLSLWPETFFRGSTKYRKVTRLALFQNTPNIRTTGENDGKQFPQWEACVSDGHILLPNRIKVKGIETEDVHLNNRIRF